MSFRRNPIIAVILVAFALGFTVSGADQRGGFVDLCAFTGANLTDHFLGLYCLNDATEVFSYNYTWINLDYCVGNNAGTLVSYENGAYSGTCTNCTIAHDATLELTCSCWDMDNHHVTSTLDLNGTIYDADGSAACYAHKGNKTWEP
ncbi:hypothetical protein QBC42DRAFT_187408 [Cladorrhinum samala]|uniref:Cyanovirin-N domain-containing protein n=1 Tax=Cladorrhinum samala TaxID=585594 RepID=A0AAV9HBU8_9PEZI|nr:hypothetical protein QBC42DRAFT_187408 [Cladorrhinum samala]